MFVVLKRSTSGFLSATVINLQDMTLINSVIKIPEVTVQMQNGS